MTGAARSRWAEVGALGTAGTVAATIFCCLPFATGVIGSGAAALGARFAPFQPYLTALSLASLGYAFYQATGRAPSCVSVTAATLRPRSAIAASPSG
jgi:hypothetical protein